MTNEIQLAQAAGLSVAGHDTNSANSHHGHGSQKPQGLKKIHRHLRGRYPLVIGLGLVVGVAGGLVGFLSQKPMFESQGYVSINPNIVGENGDQVMAGFQYFIQTQVAVLSSRELAQHAMDKPEWHALNRQYTDEQVDIFTKNVQAELMPGTNLIQVGVSDYDPKVALGGATALLSAYKDFYDNQDTLGFNSKLNLLDKQRQKLYDDLTNARNGLSSYSNKYGTVDLSGYQASEMQHLADLRSKSEEAKMEYAIALDAYNKFQTEQPKPDDKIKAPTIPAAPMTPEQIGQIDQTMHQYLLQQTQAQGRLTKAQLNYGPNHPQVLGAKEDLDILNKTIQSYADSFNQTTHTQTRGANGELVTTAIDPKLELGTKKMQMDLLAKALTDQDQYNRELGTQVELIRQAQEQITSLKSAYDIKNADYERVYSQSILNRNLMTISAPGPAKEPALDKRKQFAVLGFVGGGILPALIVLLIGVMDRRFRYSDETNSDLGGVPLLGILPNLPDLLTDPDQAATAAHCVHQIRTILQITGQTTDRRVFAVTSGSPGDGKTSLTLALGLSFAASGSRTLLIDGDLVGGGLTARLNVSSEHGILEAMASKEVLSFVRTTDVADLAILPVGEALGSYTGTIAPAAVKRLVNEAKKHFDVILIDTGPVLGSIEASPIAVSADGVILCVSRGQQRPLVDRALAHLQSIGAKLAGVVFNRAQSHDFEKSVSRMSLKPLPSTNGNGVHRPNGQYIGPVAKAVASSVRHDAPTGHDRE